MNQNIYFICPRNKFPSGGVKQIYKQVDILNQNGFNAFVIHDKPGFREKWFQNNTKIVYSPFLLKSIKYFDRKKSFLKKLEISFLKKRSFQFSKYDIIVVPEIFAHAIEIIEPELDKVIFNQNCYYTFENNDNEKIFKAYTSNKVKACLVISDDSENYLKLAFEGLKIFKITPSINELFYYSRNKKLQIAFMPRKLNEDIQQVINIIKIRNKLKNWEFIPIENNCEIEVARILKESMLLLSLNHREGLGLPPIEAMACGCIPIGYHGNGGKEYFNKNLNFHIEERNVIKFVEKIEDVCLKMEASTELYLKLSRKNADFVQTNYNLNKEVVSVVDFWKKIKFLKS